MAVLKGNSESVNQVSKVVPGPWETPVATRDKRPPRTAPSMVAGWLREASVRRLPEPGREAEGATALVG